MKTKYVLGSICVLVAGPGYLVVYLVLAPGKAAEKCLQAFNHITVGQTTEAEILALPFFQHAPLMCYGPNCDYSTSVTNSVPTFLHLASRTEMQGVVRVSNGMVTEVRVRGVIWHGHSEVEGMSWIQVKDAPECTAHPCVRKLYTPDKVLRGIVISFSPESDLRNQMLQAVDTSCFRRLHGCTMAELMPLAKVP